MSYIVIEGIDRSGKTHLSVRLNHLLKGRLVAEPFAETAAAKKAKEIMVNNELPQQYQIGMFLGQRIDLFKTVIKDYIAHKRHVVSDRSFIASMVYQSDRNYSMEEIMKTNVSTLKALGYDPLPDTLIYIDLDHETFMKRLNDGEVFDKEIRLTDETFFNKTREDYLKAIDLVVEYGKELGREIKVVMLKADDKLFDVNAIKEML